MFSKSLYIVPSQLIQGRTLFSFATCWVPGKVLFRCMVLFHTLDPSIVEILYLLRSPIHSCLSSNYLCSNSPEVTEFVYFRCSLVSCVRDLYCATFYKRQQFDRI